MVQLITNLGDKKWHLSENCSTNSNFSTGKSLSDDQTLPQHHQSCTQSEPGTLERDTKEVTAKEAASTTKLNSGE